MDTRHLLIDGVEWLGIFILLVAALPLLAVGAWVLRAVLLVAGIIAVASGCITYCVYPRFRHWADHWIHPTHGVSS